VNARPEKESEKGYKYIFSKNVLIPFSLVKKCTYTLFFGYTPFFWSPRSAGEAAGSCKIGVTPPRPI
jgi:hypothetical protein